MKKTVAKAQSRRRGGRPSQAQAARLRDKILDAATDVFFAEGYGAASIEAVAKRAKIAKRTLYARFNDKADLFEAVVHHIVEKLKPENNDQLMQGSGPEFLNKLAEVILHAAMDPRALGLLRLVLAEAARFPELGQTFLHAGGRDRAVQFIAGLLMKDATLGAVKPDIANIAAEQFLQMVVSIPQRRALGLGKPMSPKELNDWAHHAVRLFLNGSKNLNK